MSIHVLVALLLTVLQFVKGEETQTKETACNSELLAEIRKMQKKIDTMESQISSLAQANTADSSKCERGM